MTTRCRLSGRIRTLAIFVVAFLAICLAGSRCAWSQVVSEFPSNEQGLIEEMIETMFYSKAGANNILIYGLLGEGRTVNTFVVIVEEDLYLDYYVARYQTAPMEEQDVRLICSAAKQYDPAIGHFNEAMSMSGFYNLDVEFDQGHSRRLFMHGHTLMGRYSLAGQLEPIFWLPVGVAPSPLDSYVDYLLSLVFVVMVHDGDPVFTSDWCRSYYLGPVNRITEPEKEDYR